MSSLKIREAILTAKDYFPDDKETQQNSLITTVGLACSDMFRQGIPLEQVKEAIQGELSGVKVDGETTLLLEEAVNESWKSFLRNTPTSKKISSIKASDLMKMTIPAPEWAVQNMIPAGLSVLASAPKVGKSFLCLQMALSVATGQPFLEHRTEKGSVLYLSLEDTAYSLQKRLSYFLDDHRNIPSNLYLATEFPQLDTQGLLLLDQWLASHNDTRLVIIDTWGKTKPAGSKIRNAYESDVALVAPIKKLADRYKTSILLVHHLAKGGSREADWLESLSGSMGLSATVDGILSLNRDRGAVQGILKRTGRNFEEDNDIGLQWESPGWLYSGDAQEIMLHETRRAVVEAIKELGEPSSAKSISEITGRNYSTIRGLLRKMYNDRLLTITRKGHYYLPVEADITDIINKANTTNMTNTTDMTNTVCPVCFNDEEANTHKVSNSKGLEDSVCGVCPVCPSVPNPTLSQGETDTIEGGDGKIQSFSEPSQEWLKTAPHEVKTKYDEVFNRLKVFLTEENAERTALQRAWELGCGV